MKYKYIIWDWNGTLFDDVKISVDTMNIMLEKTGYKNRINSELYKNIFTFPVSDYYQKAGFDFSKDRFDDLAKILQHIFLQKYMLKCTPLCSLPQRLTARLKMYFAV